MSTDATDLSTIDRLLAAGLPLLPNDAHKKYPAGYDDWARRTFTPEEIRRNFAQRRGIGLRTGNGLEAVDLDVKHWTGPADDLIEAYEELVDQAAPGLLARLVVQATPSGGRHYLYRCTTTEPNRKRAQRPPTPEERAVHPQLQALTLTETRGDGGQIQIAPSPGYHVLSGDLADIPTITPEERAVLLECARAFDQLPRAHIAPAVTPSDTDRPGDRYNRDGGVDEALALLQRAGWTVARQRGATTYLTRPGGTRGHVHATFGAVAPGVFYPFSTNCAPFDPGTAYSPFAVLAVLQHNGDYRAAARALSARYGIDNGRRSVGVGIEDASPVVEEERWWGAVLPVPRDEVLRCLAKDEAGDAALFTALYAGRYVYDRAAGAWYAFDHPVWRRLNGPPRPAVWGGLAAYYLAVASELQRELERVDDATAKTIVAQVGQLTQRARQLRKMNRCNAVLALASDPGMLSIAGDEWDRDPWVLAVANGVLDLRTGALRRGRPDAYLTHQAPTTWTGIDTPAPRWERFVAEIMSEEPDRIAFLQRVFGYGLNGTTREHILVLLVGERGRNGKSALLETLRTVLGDYAIGVSHDVIVEQAGRRAAGSAQPHLVSLRGRRIVYTSETDDGAQISAAQVKLATGGDTITARDLFAQPVSFQPSHTLFLATNRRPHAPADDDALWERVKVIEFKARFVDAPVASDERQRDPDLTNALAAEASGILAWLVRGHLAWLTSGLQTPASVQLARDIYRLGESLDPFIADCCVLDDTSQEEATDLFEAYRSWCANHGMRPRSVQWFGRQMAARFERGRTGTGRTCYYGLRLRPASHNPSESSDHGQYPSEGIRKPKNAPASEDSEGYEPLAILKDTQNRSRSLYNTKWFRTFRTFSDSSSSAHAADGSLSPSSDVCDERADRTAPPDAASTTDATAGGGDGCRGVGWCSDFPYNQKRSDFFLGNAEHDYTILHPTPPAPSTDAPPPPADAPPLPPPALPAAMAPSTGSSADDQRTPAPPAPTTPCYRCRLRRWWLRADGQWLCAVCHPPPTVGADAVTSITDHAVDGTDVPAVAFGNHFMSHFDSPEFHARVASGRSALQDWLERRDRDASTDQDRDDVP